MSQMDKTLFITDLDGTLLSDDSKVSRKSVELLNEALAKGAMISVATARTPSTVDHLLRDVKLNLPLIVMTGAALWNPSTGLFSESVAMGKDSVAAIFSILRKHQLPAFIYCLRDDKIHVYHMGPLSEVERDFLSERINSKYKVFHIPEEGDTEISEAPEDVSLFFAMQPSTKIYSAYHEIKECVVCNPIAYHDFRGEEFANLEIFAPGASKAEALKLLKKISGADRIVAFGDNMNDIPMLREADVAVAVENAVPEVKRMADIIIEPNTSDSVASFILSSVS